MKGSRRIPSSTYLSNAPDDGHPPYSQTTLSRPHFPESRCPRRLVITVCWSLFPMWDLIPDGFIDIWIQCLLCMLDSSVWGVHNCRSHYFGGKGFHHRDISPGNMVYHYNGYNVVGVLNDWALARRQTLGIASISFKSCAVQTGGWTDWR